MKIFLGVKQSLPVIAARNGVSDQEMNCELYVFLIKFVNRKNKSTK